MRSGESGRFIFWLGRISERDGAGEARVEAMLVEKSRC